MAEVPGWIIPIIVVAVWFVLMRWVLPRIGAPT